MKTYKTRYPGIRYSKHKTRKHGVKPDECYFIRLKKEEAAGWLSEGMNAEEAFKIRSQLKDNAKRGYGPTSLAELRAEGEARKEREIKVQRQEKAKDISFKDYAENQYFPIAEPGWKPETARKHKEHCTTWLYPHLGDLPLRQITLAHINKVKAAMMKESRSPRTMQAVFRTFSMLWVSARDAEIVTTQCPTKKTSFKLPKVDNEKMRFLTTDECANLLKKVRARSEQAADMAFVSLESGLRFGEVAALTWGVIDLDGQALRVMKTKSKKNRVVPMTAKLQTLFKSMKQGRPSDIIFPNRLGKRHEQVPSLFKRGLEDAKLNEGVEDRLMKASFHSLRHTYASRMVQNGVDLYRLQRILGHSTPALTARYAKLADGDLKKAVQQMEVREKMKTEKKKAKVISMQKAEG